MKIGCILAACPPGLFVYEGCLGFKTEYADEYFVVASGEAFWGGTNIKEARAALWVMPVELTDPSALRIVAVEDEE